MLYPKLFFALACVRHVLSYPVPSVRDHERLKAACPAYQNYAVTIHEPLSTGPLHLPFQRPDPVCRTFTSPLVEKVIEDVTSRMEDPDLARIFENAFPNTLDTTISWHVDGSGSKSNDLSRSRRQHVLSKPDNWEGAHSFIVTGDIDAEWLRDSTNQLQGYQALALKDKAIANLILGAINTQVEYVIQSPYCNAFQPPPPSGHMPSESSGDIVSPNYDSNYVFECKYELDSLAAFLKLGNEYYEHTGSKDFLTKRWYLALEGVLEVLQHQAMPTFNQTTGHHLVNQFRFQRQTTMGTETLSLGGLGNPMNGGAGLIRSAFRPSDDATILPFFIPANAMMAVELKRTAKMLEATGESELTSTLKDWAKRIEGGIREHGIVKHKIYGEVYAYEVDGYGSHIIMDDANIPSLLSLPMLGFVDASDEIYQNTRKMILEQNGNPYYLVGEDFSGIGGPHIGLHHAWPMSSLVQAMTSEDDEEIMESINAVRNSSRLGLVHESINVHILSDYTRSWFAWANSVFAQTILNVAARKPHLLFGKGAKPYSVLDSV